MFNLKNFDQFGSLEVAEYVWQQKGEKPGPHIMVNGLTHGNEYVGAEVVLSLLQKMFNQQIVGGVLTVALGNVEAALQNKRYLDGGSDMNRCFAHDGEPQEYAQQRAQILKPYIADADLLIDIHSTQTPAKPFIVVPGDVDFAKYQIANSGMSLTNVLANFPVDLVIGGKGFEHPSGAPVYADTYAIANGGMGITVEAGWKDAPVFDTANQGVVLTLEQAGILVPSGEYIPAVVQQTIWQAYQNVIADKGFKFAQPFANFSSVQAGGKIGMMGSGKEIIAEQDSLVIFPKQDHLIKAGDEVCILVKQVA